MKAYFLVEAVVLHDFLKFSDAMSAFSYLVVPDNSCIFNA